MTSFGDWLTLVGGGISVFEISKYIATKASVLLRADSDRYLDYDAARLRREYYSDQLGVPSNGPPYVEIHTTLRWEDWRAHLQGDIRDDEFVRSDGSAEWRDLAERGFRALVDDGRVSANEEIVRVPKLEVVDDHLALTFQRARYHDQARSNLILDFDGKDRLKPTMRMRLRDELGRRLPPLDEPRLANTMGAALVVYYLDHARRLVPYLVRRVTKVGVYPGGLHCSASGAFRWSPALDALDLGGFMEGEILREAEEELGLRRDDFVDLRMVSVCRELIRGGKPQAFFAGVTSLTRDQLAVRRENARRVAACLEGWPEIERDRWYRASDKVLTGDDLVAALEGHGVTIEGRAAVYYGEQYLRHVQRLAGGGQGQLTSGDGD